LNATERYVDVLTGLNAGDLGLLRTYAGKGLDESLHGFDLFAGIWWPLRQQNQHAPRREVAWLAAKLYAFRPIPHSRGDTLARQLRQCCPSEERDRDSYHQRFDQLLGLPLGEIEYSIQWALDRIGSSSLPLDWVQLIDDLSLWERESTRLRWAEQFLGHNGRGRSC